jgi:hypothetical protein
MSAQVRSAFSSAPARQSTRTSLMPCHYRAASASSFTHEYVTTFLAHLSAPVRTGRQIFCTLFSIKFHLGQHVSTLRPEIGRALGGWHLGVSQFIARGRPGGRRGCISASCCAWRNRTVQAKQLF